MNKTVIIVGSAPCVYEDLNRALQMRTLSDMCLLNEAGEITTARYLATCHAEQMPKFRAIYEGVHGRNTGISYHAAQPANNSRRNSAVDHYWDGMRSGAGSAFFAVNLMLSFGYKEVILAGCPMTGGDGYYNHGRTGPDCDKYQRIGYRPEQDGVITRYQEAISKMKKDGQLERVFSMSGFTMKTLGLPPARRIDDTRNRNN